MAEAPQLLAVAGLAVAMLLLVPTFNALNEAQVLDAKPPIEIKDPPPDIEPPPDFEPPPIQPPPQCQVGVRNLFSEVFQQPGGNPGGPYELPVPVGSQFLAITYGWQEYRGDASIVLSDPESRTVFEDSSTTTATLLAPKSQPRTTEGFPATVGDWLLSVNNGGITGGFAIQIDVQGCFPPEGAGGA